MAPHRKPAKIRELEGNRSRTPIPRDVKGIGRPVAPGHLTSEQRERWDDVVGSLPVDLLSRADVAVLERMAVAWATFRATTITINQTGFLTRGSHGEVARNPLLLVRAQAAAEMHDCGMVLGLSPVARARITAPEAGESSDPLSILLGPHGKAWGDERIPAKN
jgi:P27 family predicted phage terminase small subunit